MQKSRFVLGLRLDATSYEHATGRIRQWAEKRRSCYVAVANVHMTMEAFDSLEFRQLINNSALVTPDGVPLVWGLRLLGVRTQARVYGPALTLRVCEMAAECGISIGLYGGTEQSLRDFVSFLRIRYPRLRIGCCIAPPFRALSVQEDEQYTEQISSSGVRILFVGIGCPKQERWMAEHKDRIPAVMIGVGAAFDFHSGRVKQAPAWMQRIGMEWFFRLLMEPRRLWKRYLKHNPRFVFYFLLQLLGLKRFREV